MQNVSGDLRFLAWCHGVVTILSVSLQLFLQRNKAGNFVKVWTNHGVIVVFSDCSAILFIATTRYLAALRAQRLAEYCVGAAAVIGAAE